jgi:Lamin Tail Domain/Bacterial Ig domain
MRASVFLWVTLSGCATENIFRRIRVPPEAAIDVPVQGQEFRLGTGVLTFTGTAADSYTPPSRLSASWMVDGGEPLEAEVGDDDAVQLTFDPRGLALGDHELVLVVVDGDDQQASAEVGWRLLGEIEAPVVLITQPLDGAVFPAGDDITLRGQATDNNTDPDALEFVWSSSLDGEIDGAVSGGGESAAFSSALSVGTHVITLQVTDVDGLVGADEVTVTVEEPAYEPPPAVVEAQVGDLVFNEIQVNPEVVDDIVGEWVELYNTSGGSIDLDGYSFHDLDYDSYTLAGTVIVEPGAFVVLCASVDPLLNGGIPCDAQFNRTQYGGSGSMALGNLGDEVVLSRPDGTVIDEVVYTSSWFAAAVAKGLDPEYLSADNNDDETNWCEQDTVIASGGEPGTPGEPNDPC